MNMKGIPQIVKLVFSIRGSELEVYITIDKKLTSHFVKLHPSCLISNTKKVNFEKRNCEKFLIVNQETQDRISFVIPLDATCISRIFEHTIHIEILEMWGFNQKALYIFQKAMGTFKIDQIDLNYVCYGAQMQ